MKCGQEKTGRYAPIIDVRSENPPQAEKFGPSEAMDEDHIFDAQSYRTMELDELYGLLNTCDLELGRAALQRAIAHPPVNAEDIRARQEGLREIENNEQLNTAAEELIESSAPNEQGLFELVWNKFTGLSGGDHDSRSCTGYGYSQFRKTRRLLTAVEKFGDKCGTVKSPYIKGLVDDCRAIKESRFFQLVQGPAYVTDGPPLTQSEKVWYRLGYRFRPTLFKPLFLLLLIALPNALYFMYSTFFTGSTPGYGISNFTVTGYLMLYSIVPLFFIYVAMVGSHERDSFMKPVGLALLKDEIAHSALDALGEIEVLLAHLKYRQAYPSATSHPEIIDTPHHIFEAQGIKSPIIGMEEPDYIPNDVAFDKTRLSFITGPNSGGKTALSKSVCQNQVMAQMGGFITAEAGRLSPADLVAYQVPQPGGLNRREGRFATELARTRDIFFASSPKALVVLDEPFEGTSFEERLETSEQVLDGFIRLEATVLFITHNHALAHLYKDKSSGGSTTQFLEASFENDHPTHRFKPGIASTSHAARIANEIGFGQEDIERRFEREKG